MVVTTHGEGLIDTKLASGGRSEMKGAHNTMYRTKAEQ